MRSEASVRVLLVVLRLVTTVLLFPDRVGLRICIFKPEGMNIQPSASLCFPSQQTEFKIDAFVAVSVVVAAVAFVLSFPSFFGRPNIYRTNSANTPGLPIRQIQRVPVKKCTETDIDARERLTELTDWVCI